MIRRKIFLPLPHPNYVGCDFWYTLRLTHGGMAINDDGEYSYLEGTLSVFDFVDKRKWSIKYLEGLCEQLGYMGEMRFYGHNERGG
ncbi:hypothetical protein C2S51_012456 [Perilla frutescens var. frutescens]|nr:hypothetical protein C2S51_012456 [Perilla frutescens var. frutescens]